MNKTASFLPFAAGLLAAATAADGAATRIAFVDSFATARGNAFTATADNPSAVFYNAAGLTQIEGTALHGNVFAISLAYEFDGPVGEADMDDEFQPVPSFFAAHKFADSPFAAGFGAYAPFALGSDWGSDAPFADPLVGGPGAAAVPFEAELAYIKYHAVFAWQVTETLSIAAGPSFDDATIDVKARAVEFDGDDRTVGFSASALWKPDEKHAFGLNYQAKTETTFEGKAAFPLNGFSSDASADLTFPESIVFGYAFTPNPDWSFEFNLDWTNWDRVDELVLDGPPVPAQNRTYQLNWESAFIWEAGLTRYFENGWHLSGGYTFVENAVPDDDFLPIVPDSDRHFLAIGIGQAINHLSWQLTYQQAFAEEREVSGQDSFPTVNGAWDLDSQAISLSLTYAF